MENEQRDHRGHGRHHEHQREFKNLRLRAETFNAIASFAFDNHLNLARCVDDAMADYMDKHGITEGVAS